MSLICDRVESTNVVAVRVLSVAMPFKILDNMAMDASGKVLLATSGTQSPEPFQSNIIKYL